MQEFQKNLVAAWTDYAAGKIDAKTLKGQSAGFGIYQQRDGKTMMRVRRVGGAITSADLKSVAAILREYGGDYAHLTSRQDIQLHGIPAAEIPAALEACEANGFPFRGGGGDTFRNTLVSPFSGQHEDSVFDVLPYAKALSAAFYGFDLAYGLPRKLKIGFADRPADAYIAQSNDLGFLAKIVDGQQVFETYLAGGIGFKPKLGIKIFDALPAADCIRVAMALTALFNDKGCRTNRSHARIRFLREDFGDDGLVELFRDYYAKTTDAPAARPAAADVQDPPGFPAHAAPAAGFDAWRELAVTRLSGGRAAVRVFVPFGNMTADELGCLASVCESNGLTRFEILPSQDLGIVVPADQVAGVYNLLAAFPGKDLVAKSFAGNVRSCIGCMVCKSGVTDGPAIGRTVAEHFDRRYQPIDTPRKIEIARILLNEVRISGCPNSCMCQQLVRFGFSGRKLNGMDSESTYTAGSLAPAALGVLDASVPAISMADFPAELERRILAALG
ncbi:MAG: hypothetical protein ACI4Q3_10405 [Kiritimatiellia bacterium]